MTTELLHKPSEAGPRRRRWLTPLVIATIFAVIAAAMTAVLMLNRGDDTAAPAPTGSGPAAGIPTAIATPTAPAPVGGAPGATTGPSAAAPAFRFLPLWPFAGAQEAVGWQRDALPGGHQPWRLDAGQTALTFARTYLGFTNLDRTTSVSTAGDEAWVGVGLQGEDGRLFTAAVVHLARIGAGDSRPWEVAGTRDTTLTLTTPAYRATVTSPVTVGGRITGVDESLRVQVRTLRQDAPVGEVAGIGAGGEQSPWTATVTFAAPAGSVLTIVVSTGGHAGTGVERFAITGVRTAG